MSHKNHLRSGFTIVELLIVIVVVAILATITFVAYTGIKESAQAVVVADGLKKVDKSFHLWAIQENMNRWVRDDIAGSGRSLEELIASSTPPWSSLSNYLPRAPKLQDVGVSPWEYDNDETPELYQTCPANPTWSPCMGDDKAECTETLAGKLTGVNIIIRLRDNQESLAHLINNKIDGEHEGDDWLHCGKIRWFFDDSQPANQRGMILYSISYGKQVHGE